MSGVINITQPRKPRNSRTGVYKTSSWHLNVVFVVFFPECAVSVMSLAGLIIIHHEITCRQKIILSTGEKWGKNPASEAICIARAKI